MQAEQARFLLNVLMPQIEEEFKTTCKVVGAIPEGQRDYRPHPVVKTALELAWHVVCTEVWFLEGLLRGEFAAEGEKLPGDGTVASVAGWYRGKAPALYQEMKALGDAELVRTIPFFGVMNDPAVAYLMLLVVHTVHHRGQLSTYLRAMGAKVPSIYGGSADEPFQAPSPA
jgi:uncharacterized damage-inducible protein DinB